MAGNPTSIVSGNTPRTPRNYCSLPETISQGVAESGDDFTTFSTISQWFQTLIHPALMQRRLLVIDTFFSAR
ncbi:MAG: hypothetical protein HRU34_22405 [Richelia sp.]|nr:hypothetical protein [Richelia sp.]